MGSGIVLFMENNTNNTAPAPVAPIVDGWDITVSFHEGYEGVDPHYQWNVCQTANVGEHGPAFTMGCWNLWQALAFIRDCEKRSGPFGRGLIDIANIRTYWDGGIGRTESPYWDER